MNSENYYNKKYMKYKTKYLNEKYLLKGGNPTGSNQSVPTQPTTVQQVQGLLKLPVPAQPTTAQSLPVTTQPTIAQSLPVPTQPTTTQSLPVPNQPTTAQSLQVQTQQKLLTQQDVLNQVQKVVLQQATNSKEQAQKLPSHTNIDAQISKEELEKIYKNFQENIDSLNVTQKEIEEEEKNIKDIYKEFCDERENFFIEQEVKKNQFNKEQEDIKNQFNKEYEDKKQQINDKIRDFNSKVKEYNENKILLDTKILEEKAKYLPK